MATRIKLGNRFELAVSRRGLELALGRSALQRKNFRVLDAEIQEWEKELGIEWPEKFADAAYAYKASVWVYACVDAIATTVASTPIRVMRKTKGRAEEVEENFPLRQLLRKVSIADTDWSFWEATAAYLELMGNCYWDISEQSSGQPAAIYMLHPQKIKILPDRKRFVGGYLYAVNGEKRRYEPDEIIHFKRFNPNSYYYGQSGLAAAQMSAAVDAFAQKHNRNFFKNGAVMSGVLQTDEELSDEAFERLRKQIEQKYKGVDNAHKMMVLELGLKYQALGVSPKDMDFVLQRKLSREEICAAFKVPPAVVGIYEYANYSNAVEQERAFWTRVILPRQKMILTKLNQDFCPRFGEGIYLEADVSAVKVLKEDEDKVSQIYERYLRNGVMTVNEVREKLGRKPVPWGNEDPRPVALVGDGSELEENPKTEEEKKNIYRRGAQRIAEGCQEKRLHYDIEKKKGIIYSPTRGILRGIGEELVGYLKVESLRMRAAAERNEGDEAAQREAISGLLAGFDGVTGARKSLIEELEKPYRKVFEDGAKFGAKKLRQAKGGQGADGHKWTEWTNGKKQFELVDENILNQLRKRREFWAEHWGKDTQDAMERIIVDRYFKRYRDESDAELIEGIAKELEVEADFHAERIAKTETHHVAQNAQREMFKKSLVRFFEWRHSGNPNGRPNHIALDGEVKNIEEGERFQVGAYSAEGPGDPALGPEETINCECDTWPAIGKDGEYELPEELWDGS